MPALTPPEPQAPINPPLPPEPVVPTQPSVTPAPVVTYPQVSAPVPTPAQTFVPQPVQPPVPAQPPQPIMPQPPQAQLFTSSQPLPTPAKKRFPLWLKIVGGIGILFVGLILIGIFTATAGTKAPQKVSDQFVHDLQTNNSTDAYSLTSNTFQKATNQQQLEKYFKSISSQVQGSDKITDRAVQKTAGSPETAVLVYTIKTSNGDKYAKVELEKVGDAWKVFYFKTDDKPLDSML